MVGCVWRSGGEGDEMGEGANGIEGAFEGGVRGNVGLEANSVGMRGVSSRNAVAEKDGAWQSVDRSKMSITQEVDSRRRRRASK